LLPRPETLLRWHRDLVRRKWVAFHRRPPRPRPVRDPERRECVLRLARENPRWGYKRIQGEALKLGFQISHMGVAKILRSQRIPPAPRRSQTSWREFVRQHAAEMLATDFFTVETAWLQRLHVLFFIELASRKVHLGGISASPTGEWVAQQARNLAWKMQVGAVKAKFLLRDRDSKFTRLWGAESRCEDHAACREYSCSRPPRRDRQTTSPIGWPESSSPAVPAAQGSDAAAPGCSAQRTRSGSCAVTLPPSIRSRGPGVLVQ
jgi:hypothetical protein